MNIELNALQEKVLENREARRRGTKSPLAGKISELDATWREDSRPLRLAVEQTREDYEQAKAAYQNARNNYAQERMQVVAMRSNERASTTTVPKPARITDEIKILAAEAAMVGASASRIRVILGEQSLEKAKEVIADGMKLIENEGSEW